MTTLAMTSLLADSNSWNMHGSGWWAPMMIGMVLFWGAVVLGIVWLTRGGLERRRQQTEDTALSVLDRRLAEGSLSVDEYSQRRSILMGAPPSPPDTGGHSPAPEGGYR